MTQTTNKQDLLEYCTKLFHAEIELLRVEVVAERLGEPMAREIKVIAEALGQRRVAIQKLMDANK